MIFFIKKVYQIIKLFFFKLKYIFFISQNRKKKFKNDFLYFLSKIKSGKNFGFSRFSDGELFIIQNKKLIIDIDHWILDNNKTYARFSVNEKKEFLPERDQFYREKLIESLVFKKNNYFKGIPCSCCSGYKHVNFLRSFCKDDENITFSNLLQNGNYNLFINVFLEEIKKRDIILIANKNLSSNNLPFDIKKIFTVGENCLINDYSLIKKLKIFIKDNNIRNYIFLISAASLSNIIVYELFKEYDENTYIDIGSTLNPLLGIDGWQGSRTYLKEYWENQKPIQYLNKNCYW